MRILFFAANLLFGMIFFHDYVFAEDNKGSLSLVDKPEYYIFQNKSATLRLDKKNGQICLLDKNGKVHYSESKSPEFQIKGEYFSGADGLSVKQISEDLVEVVFLSATETKISLQIEKAGDFGFKLKYQLPAMSYIKGAIKLYPVEEIYGFGETWNGQLAQRGESFEIWDKSGTPDECAWMPYFVSTNNYAFFINYGGAVKFDVGQSNSEKLTYEMRSNELEYTVLLGENIAHAVQNFVALTGMPAKPPRWSFEPWFWLMADPDIPGGDISTLRGAHFLEMVAKLKEMDIPVGVTWLEPPWQTARTTFIPNDEFCPDLKSLIKELGKQGVKTLAWTVPYTSPRASNWDEAVENGYLVGKPGGETDNSNIKITKSGELEGTFYNYIDYFNPDAFKWWQKQIGQAVDLGLKGFKLDAGQGLPSDGLLFGGRIGKDVHNSYALEYNRVFYESLKNKLGDDFLMIPRAAWIGSGACTNFKWPGDLSGSFANNGLPSSVYSSLSLAFSGIPFVSTDIGGFSDQPAPEDAWLRWAQFGAMLPGMQTLHMPWWYSEKAAGHFRYLTWLHTDLIPYWETLANEAHKTGTPICRPLVWDYQEDQNTWYVEDEFTVGEYLLVAPFMNPERMRDVYLPKGRWFDFWDDEILEGGQKTRWFKGWKDSKWKFPVYVKEGAVIPMEIKNNVSGFGGEYSKGFITLAMWPQAGAENSFVLNDREGPVPVKTNWAKRDEINLSLTGSEKDYMFRIHLHNGLMPENIYLNKNKLRRYEAEEKFKGSGTDCWFYDPGTKKLWIKKFNNNKSGEISIKLKK